MMSSESYKATREKLTTIIEAGGDLYLHEDLINRKLFGIHLEGMNLSRALFLNCDLSRASFCDSSLVDAKFCEAKLYGADLRNADLTGADMSGAHLDGANISGVVGLDIGPNRRFEGVPYGYKITRSRLSGRDFLVPE